jgi:hypothetical protein
MSDHIDPREKRSRYQPRFAGDIFVHMANAQDPPLLRKLASTVEWKNPPSARVRAEVST